MDPRYEKVSNQAKNLSEELPYGSFFLMEQTGKDKGIRARCNLL